MPAQRIPARWRGAANCWGDRATKSTRPHSSPARILIRHGVARGPIYRLLLERVRDAQLDGEIHTREEALALVDRILQEGSDEGDGSSAPT